MKIILFDCQFLQKNKMKEKIKRAKMCLGYVSIIFFFISFFLVFFQIVESKANIQTPPMGWNSWNAIQCSDDLNENKIKEIADIIESSGLAEVGYNYVNIDDCWADKTQKRDVSKNSNEELREDKKRFPSGMKNLVDYVHKKNLKFGIYADIGKKTCAGYPGSYGFEAIDVHTFYKFGVDYIKLDGCYAPEEEVGRLYKLWAEELEKIKVKKEIVFSCSWPCYIKFNKKLSFWLELKNSCDLWRAYDDIQPSWKSVKSILNFWAENQNIFSTISGPGAINDPDMLEIGNGLTDSESKTHLSLWAILSAPLILGNDLQNLNYHTLNMLTNKEVIAVNQDRLVHGGIRVYERENEISLWAKKLSNGNIAVAVINLSEKPSIVEFKIDNIYASMYKHEKTIHFMKNEYERYLKNFTSENYGDESSFFNEPYISDSSDNYYYFRHYARKIENKKNDDDEEELYLNTKKNSIEEKNIMINNNELKIIPYEITAKNIQVEKINHESNNLFDNKYNKILRAYDNENNIYQNIHMHELIDKNIKYACNVRDLWGRVNLGIKKNFIRSNALIESHAVFFVKIKCTTNYYVSKNISKSFFDNKIFDQKMTSIASLLTNSSSSKKKVLIHDNDDDNNNMQNNKLYEKYAIKDLDDL